ncbi:MAG TPA: tetraacyldisaccharide 4'-kinase [Phycisphaerae bacterium]|nr:tetraacyldisaccharide 4'-kinase [Phycisphaerae bacterium]
MCRLFKIINRVVGWPYLAVMAVRRWAYGKGFLRSYSAAVPVICVGNITTGGTGKTPMVAFVVKALQSAGRKPAIITRGYRAVDGKSDEAELLGAMTGADVIVNPDRVAGAAEAVRRGADIIVMDDGYQHLRLRRDFNVVLIDASNPFGGDAGLPLGRLRECPRTLRFADAVVITRSDTIDELALDGLLGRIAAYGGDVPVARAVHSPVDLIDLNGDRKSLKLLDGKRIFAFCGLGNPAAFERTLRQCGAEIAGMRLFGDHVHYTPAIAAELSRQADACNAEMIVTTCKDGVKLSPEWFFKGIELFQLAIEMRLVGGEEFISRVESLGLRR